MGQVTLTVKQLAIAVRVTTADSLATPEPYQTILIRQLSVATKTVERYAPDAPDDVLDEAVIRMVGYWLESPGFTRTAQNAFVHSGVRRLLSEYRIPVSSAV